MPGRAVGSGQGMAQAGASWPGLGVGMAGIGP